jgi:hypothetical protein
LVRSASTKAAAGETSNIDINEVESNNYAHLDTQISDNDERLPAWASSIVFAPPANIKKTKEKKTKNKKTKNKKIK